MDRSGPDTRPARRRRPASRTRPAPRPNRTSVEMTSKALRAARPADPKQPQGLLPADRGRLDRQAGPRSQPVRPDRRDRRVRQAVQLALRYQRNHPDTLVVVTADHGHTSQIVEAGTDHDGRHRDADHARRRGHDDQLRHQPSSRHPSSTPAPRSGSRRRDRRRPTSWASPTRPTSSTPSSEHSGSPDRISSRGVRVVPSRMHAGGTTAAQGYQHDRVTAPLRTTWGEPMGRVASRRGGRRTEAWG